MPAQFWTKIITYSIICSLFVYTKKKRKYTEHRKESTQNYDSFTLYSRLPNVCWWWFSPFRMYIDDFHQNQIAFSAMELWSLLITYNVYSSFVELSSSPIMSLHHLSCLLITYHVYSSFIELSSSLTVSAHHLSSDHVCE